MTPDVRLVPYRPEHAPLLFAFRNQAASRRHNPLAPLTVDELDLRLRLESSDLSRRELVECFRWVVEVDGAVAGSVSFKNVNWPFGTGELGYGIDEALHGRGIGTEAVRQVVEILFRETSLRRLFALVDESNAPSLRLLEKLGFVREGVLREHFVIAGRPVNEVVLGLLRREWERSPR